MRMYTIVAALIFSSACSSSPTAPTTATAPLSFDLSYTINVPDAQLAQADVAQHPDGVRVSPIEAQVTWDYTKAYGSSNVYWGTLAPPTGAYTMTGIVVAPVAVANEASFLASEWPDANGRPFGGGSPMARYTWVGRFVYTEVGR